MASYLKNQDVCLKRTVQAKLKRVGVVECHGTAYHNITDTELRNSSSNLDGDDFVMAYQFGSGALFPLNDKTSVDIGYRFFGTSDADISSNNGNFTAGYSSHIWKIGITHQL